MSVPDQSAFTAPAKADPSLAFVQVRAAAIPRIDTIAVHCYFVARRPGGRMERWEVWQNPSEPWGHVRRRRGGFTSGVGAGPSRVLAEFTGEKARRICQVLQRPESYPWRERYAYYPGPNSNTYAAWVLREAGVRTSLPLAAIGQGLIGDRRRALSRPGGGWARRARRGR